MHSTQGKNRKKTKRDMLITIGVAAAGERQEQCIIAHTKEKAKKC
jgi:hypothetical protein